MTIATLTIPALAPAHEAGDPVLERAAFFAEWDWSFEMTSVVPQAASAAARSVF